VTLHWRLARFVAVGSAAAAVHLGVVVALVQAAGARPLQANVLGWLAAFVVSFTGQYRLTFADRAAALLPAMRRFLAISLLGFAANEAGYALALRAHWLRYDLALVLVLMAVAVMTYLLSSAWAFRRRPHPRPASSR
jgi:putative flippase GtrA